MAKEALGYEERLTEIAGTVFGELSDDQILRLLAERKQLSELQQEYEAAQEKRTHLLAAEAEKAGIEQELTRLNTLISPDQPDEELIHLVEERKGLEAKLAEAEQILAKIQEDGIMDEPAPRIPKKTAAQTKERAKEQVAKKTEEAPAEIAVPETPVILEAPEEPVLPTEIAAAETVFQDSVDEEFGDQKIQGVAKLEPGSELERALDRIMNDPAAVGTILDGLPSTAKSNKAFMLGVAAVDPAYAMHYADKETLKRDEDFNLRVLATKGKRLSGSVLSEMLPEARTEAVVMAAIKQDYRNVRYALPQMAGYEEMLTRAKRAALEKVRELKDGVSVALLVPKILQKDRAFMEQVNALVPKTE